MSSEAPARAEIPIIYGWRKYLLSSSFDTTMTSLEVKRGSRMTLDLISSALPLFKAEEMNITFLMLHKIVPRTTNNSWHEKISLTIVSYTFVGEFLKG